MSKKLTVIPSGGLGNRMKAVAAAMRLANETGAHLQVVWHRDWGLGCRFDQLFEPIEQPRLEMTEASLTQHYTLDRPRRKNLFLPYLFEHLRYSRIAYEREATQLMQQGFDFAAWSRGHNTLVNSCTYFYSQDIPINAFDCFKPNEQVRAIADAAWQYCASKRTIGVHIRRTDHATAIKQSPTELFVERMRREPEGTLFYLASDSAEVKSELKAVFGQQLIYNDFPTTRGDVAGMQYALAEMILLSRCEHILGSAASTFSQTAAAMGHIACEAVKL